jgi:hypothetical protein
MPIPAGYTSGQIVQAVPTGINSALVCVKAETAFSAVASVTADSVFTSAYTNYQMVIRYQSSSGSIDIQFRAATVDTTSGYNLQLFNASGTGTTASRVTSQTSASIAANSGGAFWSTAVVNISGPQLAEPTSYHSLNTRNDGAYTNPMNYQYFGNQSSSTSFDGIKILGTSMTGSYTIYGYSKTV